MYSKNSKRTKKTVSKTQLSDFESNLLKFDSIAESIVAGNKKLNTQELKSAERHNTLVALQQDLIQFAQLSDTLPKSAKNHDNGSKRLDAEYVKINAILPKKTREKLKQEIPELIKKMGKNLEQKVRVEKKPT